MIFSNLLKDNKGTWLPPVLFLITLGVTHLLFGYYSMYIESLLGSTKIHYGEQCAYLTLTAIGEYWLCVRLLAKTFSYLDNNLNHKYPTLCLILPFFNALLKALSFLIILNLLTQNLDLSAGISYALNKATSILITCAIGWLLLKMIDVAEQLLIHHFTAQNNATMERKIFTQTLILKRVACSIVCILTAGAILMLFDNVRALGASVLTSAGVVGLVLTFTAQRSLASIFSGLEIALTQPIKIGDSVIIDSEFGVIEEINFRNVVVKLWDWRRLIVPTSFFLEKNFQNWSRFQDSNLIGTVLMYVDFSLPVDKARKHLEQILQSTPLWDKNVGSLHVGDLQERVMQIKILASSHNSDSLSDLRALIREQMMNYIVKKHPYALPKTRSFTVKEDVTSDVNTCLNEEVYI